MAAPLYRHADRLHPITSKAILLSVLFRSNQVALDAAEAGGQHALYIKLSNNMGAVLRKQELHEEVRQYTQGFKPH